MQVYYVYHHCFYFISDQKMFRDLVARCLDLMAPAFIRNVAVSGKRIFFIAMKTAPGIDKVVFPLRIDN